MPVVREAWGAIPDGRATVPAPPGAIPGFEGHYIWALPAVLQGPVADFPAESGGEPRILLKKRLKIRGIYLPYIGFFGVLHLLGRGSKPYYPLAALIVRSGPPTPAV